VILIVSRKKTDEAYWVSVKDYFADPKRRAAHCRRTRFYWVLSPRGSRRDGPADSGARSTAHDKA